MKTNTTRTTLLRMSIPVLLMALPGMAAVMHVSYDFGTDPGKTTYEDAGFTAGGSGLTITDESDHVLMTATSRHRGGILRTFDGLGGSERNNFTITAQYTIADWDLDSSSEWQAHGILLFAQSPSETDLRNTGLGVHLQWHANDNEDSVAIQTARAIGIGGGDTWAHSAISAGDVMQWEVDVSYSGADDMFVTGTLTRINDGASQTVSSSALSASSYGGEYFGFGGRYLGPETHLDTFAVIPEPGTLMLVGIALGSLLVFRRRRK